VRGAIQLVQRAECSALPGRCRGPVPDDLGVGGFFFVP
jgi:hypothetical protein